MADTDKEADQASKYEMPEWTKDSAAPCLMEKSKFATLFPKYLENYLQTDDITYDIIKISSMVRNKERFVKRRQRIIGPNAQTLKALELLTETYLLVQGNTVAVMGTWKGCKAVRKVVTDCMRNVHPIYGIKQLLIKRELGKDPEMKNEDWSKYVPQFRKTHQKKRKLGGDNEEGAPKKKAKKEKKPYTAFPPEQQPRKEDLLMASGEFWRLEQEKEKQKEKKK
eukprot:gene7516-11511_t